MTDYPYADSFYNKATRQNLRPIQSTLKQSLALAPHSQTHQHYKDGHTDAYAYLFYGPDRRPLEVSYDDDATRKHDVLQDIMGIYGLHNGQKSGKGTPAAYRRQSSLSSLSSLQRASPTSSLQGAIEECIQTNSHCPVNLLNAGCQPGKDHLYIPQPENDPIVTSFAVIGGSYLSKQTQLTPLDRDFPPQMCSVCNSFSHRETRQLPSLRASCGHVFHTLCLLPWFLQDTVPLTMACDVCQPIHYNVRFKFLRPSSWEAPTGEELWIRFQRVVNPGESIEVYRRTRLPYPSPRGSLHSLGRTSRSQNPSMVEVVVPSYPMGEYELRSVDERSEESLSPHEYGNCTARGPYQFQDPSGMVEYATAGFQPYNYCPVAMSGCHDQPRDAFSYHTHSHQATLGTHGAPAPPGFQGRPMSSGFPAPLSRSPNQEQQIPKRTNFQYRGNAYTTPPPPPPVPSIPTAPHMPSEGLQSKKASKPQNGGSGMRRMVLSRNASGTVNRSAHMDMESARQVFEGARAEVNGRRHGEDM
jgi:hypothetical protein